MILCGTTLSPCHVLGASSALTHGGKLAKVLHITERLSSLTKRYKRPQSHDDGHKELEVCTEGRCTIISTKKLLSKVLVLPRDEYAQLQYTGTENHIYSASAQWEEQEADRENKFNSKYLFASSHNDRDSSDNESDNESENKFAMTQGDW